MNNGGILNFKQVEIEDYSRIYPYTSAYGEGSCQHSPVSMYSLSEKYMDEVCIRDDVLYTLRSALCDDVYRVYLSPLTGGSMREAFAKVLQDAASYGKKVQFLSLTKKASDILSKEFPEEFDITEDRNLAEYIYRTEVMAGFLGHSLTKRRQQVRRFMRDFGERTSITKITEEDAESILRFEHYWIEKYGESHDVEALKREERMIIKQFAHFDELRLSGIVLRIDEKVYGFGYGTKLNDEYYDAIVEKGDYSIPNIYKVLRRESVRLCAMDSRYVNMEEDVGIEGLRNIKLSYHPEYLLHKYIAKQK